MKRQELLLLVAMSVVGCGDPPATQGSSSAAKSASAKASASAMSAAPKPSESAVASAAPTASASPDATAGDAGTSDGFDSAEALAKHVVATMAEMKADDVKKAYPTDAFIDGVCTCAGGEATKDTHEKVAKALKEKAPEGGPFTFVSVEAKEGKAVKKGAKDGPCEFKQDFAAQTLTIKVKDKDGKEKPPLELNAGLAGGKWVLDD